MHALAAGVLEASDTGETVGVEDPLHVRVAVSSQDLAAHALTLTELASVFQGDVRLAAAVIQRALA